MPGARHRQIEDDRTTVLTGRRICLMCFRRLRRTEAWGAASRNLSKYVIAASLSAARFASMNIDMWSRLPTHRSAEETTTRSLARGENAIESTLEALHTLHFIVDRAMQKLQTDFKSTG